MQQLMAIVYEVVTREAGQGGAYETLWGTGRPWRLEPLNTQHYYTRLSDRPPGGALPKVKQDSRVCTGILICSPPWRDLPVVL